jgi:lipopolysaccharide/colanic/teichoic acid biosynthesis glycosyltransferase
LSILLLESELAVSTAGPVQNISFLQHAPITLWGRVLKRTIDLIGSSVLLIAHLPLMASLAVLIKFQDGGPVIYRRRVVGKKGEFDAFKFRSMRMDADEVLEKDAQLRKEFEINFKLKNDSRVTPVGKIIRKLSLDELPQLFNVLRGEMSLVGPRMITPPELRKYGDAGWIFNIMKPGLTGYWQIYGRQQVSYDERVEMDLHYVKNWSVWLDLKILARTPLKVVRGAGAY